MNRESIADRALPADVDAEQSLLGCVTILWDCLDDVALIAAPEDFYDPAHRTMFEHMLAIRETGRKFDTVLFTKHLRDSGDLEMIGGAAYLSKVINSVPNAAHAIYYAEIVRDCAARRGMIHAATEIAASGYDRADVSEYLAQAEASVFAATNRCQKLAGAADLNQSVLAALGGLDRRAAGQALRGVSTGLHGLDSVTGGFQAGEVTILAGRTSMGKAQPLDAQVLTPTGFVPIGELKVLAKVISRDGKPVFVNGIYERGKLPVYRVRFSDGTSTRCCGEHLWFTNSWSERRRNEPGSVKSTEEILGSLVRYDGRPHHRIPLVESIDFDDPAEPTEAIDPYALGLLLGDGDTSSRDVKFTNSEPDIRERFQNLLPDSDEAEWPDGEITTRVRRKQRNNARPALAVEIERVGLMGCDSYTKRVPDEFLLASPIRRLRLLQGLMDTDGYVVDSGQSVEYTTASPQLAADVAFLVRSLGGIVSCHDKVGQFTHRGEKRTGALCTRMNLWFPNGIVPVSSAKHLARWKSGDKKRFVARTIVAIEPDGIEECRCISVDSEDGLYVTDHFIVTHNTALAINIAADVATESPVLLFSLEMDALSIAERLLSTTANVRLGKMRDGTLSKEDRARLSEAADACGRLKIRMDDTSGRTVSQIASVCRREYRRGGLSLVIIDYLQLLEPDNHKEPRHEQVSKISRRLKALARELKVPLLVLAQLNRQATVSKDNRPALSHLRESGAIEQDADVVIFCHRPAYYTNERTNGEGEKAELIVAKNRQGPTASIDVLWFGSAMSFRNKADDRFAPSNKPNRVQAFDQWNEQSETQETF